MFSYLNHTMHLFPMNSKACLLWCDWPIIGWFDLVISNYWEEPCPH